EYARGDVTSAGVPLRTSRPWAVSAAASAGSPTTSSGGRARTDSSRLSVVAPAGTPVIRSALTVMTEPWPAVNDNGTAVVPGSTLTSTGPSSVAPATPPTLTVALTSDRRTATASTVWPGAAWLGRISS